MEQMGSLVFTSEDFLVGLTRTESTSKCNIQNTPIMHSFVPVSRIKLLKVINLMTGK